MYLTYKDIIKDDNPIMRTKSSDVITPLNKADLKLAKALLKYVVDSQDEVIAEEKQLRPAVGISAIQINVAKKITAIVVHDEEDNTSQYLLANPKIISESVQRAYLKAGEGCLSVENTYEGYVPRSARIKVKAYDILTSKDIELSLSEYPAIVFQHELDHFQGIMFYDHINKENPFFEKEDDIIIE